MPASKPYFWVVVAVSLREELELRVGTLPDSVFAHLLDMALDDLKQYVSLTPSERNSVLEPEKYPPNDAEHLRLVEIRERMLESMVTLADIVSRHKMKL